jgi:hypothetical protein
VIRIALAAGHPRKHQSLAAAIPPKRTNLSSYGQSDLDKIALRLDQRPRKTLGCGYTAGRRGAGWRIFWSTTQSKGWVFAAAFRDHKPTEHTP